MKAFTDFLDRMTGHLERGPVSHYVDSLDPEAKHRARYEQKKKRLIAEMAENLGDQMLAEKLMNPSPENPKDRIQLVESMRFGRYALPVTDRLIDRLPILQYKIKLLAFPVSFIAGLLAFTLPAGLVIFALFSAVLGYLAIGTFRLSRATGDEKGLVKAPWWLLKVAARQISLPTDAKKHIDEEVAENLLFKPVEGLPRDLDDVVRPAAASPSGESLQGKFPLVVSGSSPLEEGVRVFSGRLIFAIIAPVAIGLTLGMGAVASPATPITMAMISLLLIGAALGFMAVGAAQQKAAKQAGMWNRAGVISGTLIVAWLGSIFAIAPFDQVMSSGARFGICIGVAVAYLVVARISATAPRKDKKALQRLLYEVLAKGADASEGIGASRQVEQETQTKLIEVERLRNAQREAAAKDKTPMYTLGEATGMLADRNVIGAPMLPGLPVALSKLDLSEHLFIVGKTGSGKTTRVIEPLVKEWVKGEDGLLVADGKGVLPGELASKNPDLQLINPSTCPQLNPIEGLTPPQVTSALRDALGNGGSESVWEQQGKKLIMSAAYMLRLCVEHKVLGWTLDNLQKIAEDDNEATKIVKETFEAAAAGEPGAPNRRLSLQEINSYEYLYHILPNVYAKETSSSIRFNVDAWFAEIAIDEFEPWLTSAEGFELESVLRGGRIGIDLPYRLYGAAGARMAKLLKRRIYNALQGRTDNWASSGGKSFLFVMDEAQDLVDKEDNEILAKSRSLGCSMVVSTQSVDAIQIALQSREAAAAFLGNLSSMISLRTNTPETLKFVSERLGERLGQANDLYGSLQSHYASAANALRVSDRKDMSPEFWSWGIEPKKKGKHDNPAKGAYIRHVGDAKGYKAIENRDTALDHKNTIPYQATLPPSELEHLLGRGLAIAVLSRAGQYRRDVIRIGSDANAEVI